MSSLPELDTEDVSSSLPTTRVDRLLRERIRRNRSHQAFDVCEDLPQEDPVLETVPEPPTQARLVVVANRLPVTCSKDSSGRWQLQASAGGLVSALKGVGNYMTLWIGWPGIWVKHGRERDELTAILKAEGFSPVWMEPTLLDLYYNGFCNSVLWQLFHYVPLNIDTWQKMAEHRAMQLQWQAYQAANEKFADVVLMEYMPTDVVWVQDYHLMLLPSLLKQNVAKMKVGFFLHTPFPSSEMYRSLPVREEVLRAVLAADLVGFHTYDYARHFISSCTRILGLEGTPEGVENNGVLTRVGTFPIGIDPERFTRALESEEVQSQTAKLLNRYAGRKIMLGVDRLDMVKGIPQKLLAYEKFLEEHPEWRDKVLLVQIAVPSRTDVPEYQKLRSMVHEIVGRINGQYGTLTYVPIYHLDTSLSFTELCALYAVTDVALVTSLRDGMNLVSYEYVACQSDNAGVLVLSEFAGAAQSLGAGALLVNPWNISDMSNAIYDALSMSEEERRERHRQNYMHVQTHTAQHWADTFITELNDTHIEADLRMRHTPPPLDVQEVVRAYQCSRRRLVVLGYNATLTTSVEAPRLPKRQFEQVKALAKVNPRVMQSVCELCTDPANVVVIFSGSETSKLDEIFGHLPVWLAAENGVYVRPPAGGPLPHFCGNAGGGGGAGGGGAGGRGPGSGAQGPPPPPPPLPQWKCVFDQVHCEWMESVQLVFDYFCERTPRSFVEARETSLVWNYKYADVEFGRIQARDLLQHLWTGPISNAPVEIIQGGKSVEVRPVGVTKGLAMQRLVGLIAAEGGIEAAAFDMVLCIGHLLGRDENLFSLFEGAKIDGAAPGQHNRAERLAAANAAAAAAAAAGAGQAEVQQAFSAAAAARGRGAGAGAAAARGHGRSSSTGGMHHLGVEDAPTGRLGSGGGAAAAAAVAAAAAMAALQQPGPLGQQQPQQQQPQPQGARPVSGRGPSGLTQAFAARSSTPAATFAPGIATTPVTASPFLAHSGTPLPPSTSPRNPSQVPMAVATSSTSAISSPMSSCSLSSASATTTSTSAAPTPTAAAVAAARAAAPIQANLPHPGFGAGAAPAQPHSHSHPHPHPHPHPHTHPILHRQAQPTHPGFHGPHAAAGLGVLSPSAHSHPHPHPHPHAAAQAGPAGPSGHFPRHPQPQQPPPQQQSYPQQLQLQLQGGMPPHMERLGRGSGGGAAGAGGGGGALQSAGGSAPDVPLQRRFGGGGGGHPNPFQHQHQHQHHHQQQQQQGHPAHPHPHRPHQTHSMDRVDLVQRLAAAAAGASGNNTVADRLAGIFPPKYLYTCTVGRNRSKARYALATSAEVGDLLEAIVNQGIYRRPCAATCACSAPADLSLASLGLGGLPGASPSSRGADSLSSADAMSPDSMLSSLLGQQAAAMGAAAAMGGLPAAGGGEPSGIRKLREVDRLSAMSLPLEESFSLPHPPNATGLLGGEVGGGGGIAPPNLDSLDPHSAHAQNRFSYANHHNHSHNNHQHEHHNHLGHHGHDYHHHHHHRLSDNLPPNRFPPQQQQQQPFQAPPLPPPQQPPAPQPYPPQIPSEAPWAPDHQCRPWGLLVGHGGAATEPSETRGTGGALAPAPAAACEMAVGGAAPGGAAQREEGRPAAAAEGGSASAGSGGGGGAASGRDGGA